ncbi:hypothetical protein PR202_gb02353 [Eleusine coracana subsp. coracana]|uniref:Poly(A) RNA polymerase mitochondrial-like central palm domain-containing protein n=1 Tax=Eleusine coracana subsp. coracana TaxID=191504 RepID=A0AAV5DY10_ELECO|nr:hypothetical protein PR202_gb02353 [Eleusine coracana subsp. coracana]
MAAAASPPAPPIVEPSSSQGLLPRPSVAISSDSQALHRHAERCEMESKAFMDPVLLPTLEVLLQEVYTSLRPEPVDYEHRQVMIDVFNKMAEQIFGKRNGLPIVEPFGSFTMDLFTAKSDLDLSVNFRNDVVGEFPRKDKISAIRRLAKVLHDHQRNGRCYGVLPIVTAIVPVLKMKFWAKSHGINSPKDRTISSMAIIALVAFHLQTRHPPILPAFSGILKGTPSIAHGSDLANIERNVLLYKGFGSRNKESVAELFVSLMSKLVSVEGLWEQGLCASNFEGSWISKTWDRGVGNLSVEDFMDRSQNFARSVGKEEMQTICECLRAAVSSLSNFFMGKIDAPRLKALLFGSLNQDKPIINVSQRNAKRKRVNPIQTSNKKNGKRKRLDQDKPLTPPVQTDAKKRKLDQDKPIIPPVQEDAKKKKLHQDKPVTPIKNDAKKKKLHQDKPVTPIKNDAKKKKLHQDKLVTPPVQEDAKKKKLHQDKPVTPVQKDAKKKKVHQDKPVTPIKKDAKKKKPGLDKAVAPTILKDAKSSTLRPDLGNRHVQQKNYTASGPRPPTVFNPPQTHQPVPTHPSTQFPHIPQHLINHLQLAHGLPQPQLPPAYHPYQGLVCQPQGNFIHFNRGIQLQHQGQAIFAPSASHHPVMDRLHPYGVNSAQQMQHYDNRFIQRPPYGIGPGFWR